MIFLDALNKLLIQLLRIYKFMGFIDFSIVKNVVTAFPFPSHAHLRRFLVMLCRGLFLVPLALILGQRLLIGI